MSVLHSFHKCSSSFLNFSFLNSSSDDRLRPEIPRNIKQVLIYEGKKQELYLNQKVKSLLPLLSGEVVQMKPHVRSKKE